MRLIGGVQHRLATGQDEFRLAPMHHGRGQQAESRVAVFFVVPREELPAKGAAVLDRAEAVWELGQGNRLKITGGVL
jgi:hypothetical protein